MEVGELNLHGGGHQGRGGLDDHCHHLGVEQCCVAVEGGHFTVSVQPHKCVKTTNTTTQRPFCRKGRHLVSTKSICWKVNLTAVPLGGHDRGEVSVEDDSGHKGVISICKQNICLDPAA